MGSLRFYGGTNLGGKPRLSYITYPLSFVTKSESSFGLRVVLYLEGQLVWDIFVRGSVYRF